MSANSAEPRAGAARTARGNAHEDVPAAHASHFVKMELSHLKAEAKRLGFSACGVARAGRVDEATVSVFRKWIADDRQGEMHYLENHEDLRFDPRLLFPGARSVVAVALNYFPRQRLLPGQYQFAYYAYGRDYHDVMRSRLSALARAVLPEGSYRVCCDTAPMLDRYWAWKAGLGWTGRNSCLILPRRGSYFFLGEILTTAQFDIYDTPMDDQCGACDRCLRACPTHALRLGSPPDARLCLSYLTIENRGDIPSDAARRMGTTIYGCDRCQLACPHNRQAQPTEVDDFAPSPDFLSMTPSDWRTLTLERYREIFRGSAVKRAKYDGLMRNIGAARRVPADGDNPPCTGTEVPPCGDDGLVAEE